MNYFFLAILVTFFPILCWYVHIYFSRVGKLITIIPGPASVPLFGNLLQLHAPLVEINNRIRAWGKLYYPIYKMWFGIKPLIHVRHPDDLEILLTSTKHTNKEFAYEHFHSWLKTGLLTSNGDKWQKRRKILSPAFHFNILKKYMEITDEQSEKFVSDCRTKKEMNIDLLKFSTKYTLNIICESAMGVALDDDSHKEAGLKYKDAVYKMGDLIIFRMIRPYIYDWMTPYMPTLNKKITEVLNNLNYFTNKIVDERRNYHESTGYKQLKSMYEDESSKSNNYIGQKKRMAMLDLLLEAERNNLIDDEGIKEEVATFIFEGHDTTAMAMVFTIMLLAENEDAQSKARDEVEEILKRTNNKLDTSDLQEMNYLERCIKEALRLYPSVPSIGREIKEDLKLKHYIIPKGSAILMHIIDVHRDPEFWPEPDKFDPNRFLPDLTKKRHPFSYIPFSAGSRNCIGQKFAIMELKIIMSRILYNFYLEPITYTRDVKIKSDVVIRPDKPVCTKFIRIDRHTAV